MLNCNNTKLPNVLKNSFATYTDSKEPLDDIYDACVGALNSTKLPLKEAISILSTEAKQFFLVNQLIGEVYNGGFAQFITNPSGFFCYETLVALEQISAQSAYKQLEAAIIAVNSHAVTYDSETVRTKLIEIQHEGITVGYSKLKASLADLDAQFYKSMDTLDELLLQYVNKNKHISLGNLMVQ